MLSALDCSIPVCHPMFLKSWYQHLEPAGVKYRAAVGVAVALVATSAVIRHYAMPLGEHTPVLILFYPIVIFSVWFGGVVYGALVTLLSVALLVWVFSIHTGIDLWSNWITISSLTVEGIAVSVLFQVLVHEREQVRRLEQLNEFINEAPAAIAVFDTDMRYLAVSKRWISDYSLEGQEILGRSHYDILPEIPQRWRDVHARCLAGAVEMSRDDEFVRADGRKQWLAWEAKPWRRSGRHDGIGGIIIFSEDITEIKEACRHEGIMRAQAEFDKARRQEAEALMRAKDDFIATLSHELRTPLNALLSWTQLLARTPEDPVRLKQALAAIQQSGMLLAQLIADIVDINRIASGKLRLHIDTFTILSLIDKTLTTVSPLADDKGVAIEKSIDAPETAISGDIIRLQQCLWNLLINAIKFTPRGGRITISAQITNGQLKLVVSDTGKGIAKEIAPLLFERFVQGDLASSRVHGSLGLGLAIVKHLVGLHGGSVSVESEGAGKGSTFIIFLPVDQIAETEGPPITQSCERARTSELSGFSILVVDDNLEARELLREIFEERGARVLTATSAESALQIVEKSALDLVLSDISMPSRDGYDLIRDIRALGKAVPAIALSASAGLASQERSLGAGFDQHLVKPVESERLLDLVHKMLDQKVA